MVLDLNFKAWFFFLFDWVFYHFAVCSRPCPYLCLSRSLAVISVRGPACACVCGCCCCCSVMEVWRISFLLLCAFQLVSAQQTTDSDEGALVIVTNSESCTSSTSFYTQLMFLTTAFLDQWLLSTRL